MCARQGSGPAVERSGDADSASAAARPSDNTLCLSCHQEFARELISREHRREGVLCVDCHGLSLAHARDSTHQTPPDVVFDRTAIDPYCYQCHHHRHNPAELDRFIEEWQGRRRPNGRAVTQASVCTDCHGEHVMPQRIAGTEPAGSTARPWIQLFNGRDLTGWKPVGNARWLVENGILTGMQGEKNAPGDLLTESSYGDFLLKVIYQVVWPANTGVWFRYQTAGKAYQADILEWPDPVAFSGTIYCPGKMFIAINADKSIEERDGWNTMTIRAEGDRLRAWLNGRQTADVRDTLSDSGRIGFQVHAGDQFARMKIMIREARLQQLTD
jgi:hypothetical protein